MKECLSFIQNNEEGDQALVLLGNSGAGKSLYLIQLYRQIELLR